MIKKIIGIIVIVLVLGTGLYINYCNIDPSIFITEGTNAFIYGEKDDKLEEAFKDIEKLILEEGSLKTETYEEMNKLEEYIQKSFFINKENNLGKSATENIESLDILMGINFGNYYLPFRSNLYKYFDKTDSDNYKLKEKHTKEFIDGFKSMDKTNSFKNIENVDIYLKPVKSYFLISFSEKTLINHLNEMENEKMNQKLISEYKNMRSQNKNFGIIDIDKMFNSKEKNKNIGYSDKLSFIKVYYKYDYKIDQLKVFYELQGEDGIFSAMGSEKIENQKLVDFIDENRLYFSNNSFANISREVLEEIKTNQGIDYNQLSKMFLGAQIPELVDDIGNELVLDYSKFDNLKLMTNLKNRSRLEKTFDKLGISKNQGEYILSPNLKLIPEEKYLFINNKIKKADENIEIPKDSFLYSKVNLESLFQNNNNRNLNNLDFSNVEFEILGKTSNESLTIEIDILKKAIKKMLLLGIETSNKKDK